MMRGTIEEEISSTIFYSFMGSKINLGKVYEAFYSKIEDRFKLDDFDLRETIAHKSAEYLIHKKIDSHYGGTKPREVDKAEGFFLRLKTINKVNS